MNFLIANPFGIGDVLFSLPLVQTLRQQNPDAKIAFLCNRRTEELVSAWPELDQTLVFEKDEFKEAWKRSKREGLSLLLALMRTIRAGQYDALIDLSLSGQIAFSGWLAGISLRVGFDYRQRGRFLTGRLTIPGFHTQSVADYYLDLLPLVGQQRPEQTQLQMSLPKSVAGQVSQLLDASGISPAQECIALIPGGGASWGPNAIYKQWPPKQFAQAATWLTQHTQSQILLLGDAQEKRLCEEIAQGMPSGSAQVIQVPSLLTLAGLLKHCTLVFGNDSGPLHLAAAVGTKTVSIFGPVDPSVYGPLGNLTRHAVVTKGLVCQPCYHEFRFPECPWNNQCLRELSVEQVTQTLEKSIKPTHAQTS